MSRLALRIYLGFVGILALFFVGASLHFVLIDHDHERWQGPPPRAERRSPAHGVGLLVGLALAIGAGAWPVARSITRRLERVSQSVEALGEGTLSARAPVEGRDEVARLAVRFNHMAGRVEALVAAQRTLLASASHELRSPLARLRVAAELLTGADGARLSAERLAELRAGIASDVTQLDHAVEELLLASRLDAAEASGPGEPVDLLALVVEETAAHGEAVHVDGSGEAPALLSGDPRSLRHLVRNLVGNALRHAPGTPVDIRVAAGPGGGAVLSVADRGPGVDAADRERIFEPFARGGDATAQGTEGVGLGLALVRRIARHHGGDATVEDRPGGGTVFRVTLPGRSSDPC